MKQHRTEHLQRYWDTLRGRRAAPERNDIDPGEIRNLLPDVFILDFDLHRIPSIRLAGTRLCSLFGREIGGNAFCSLFVDKEQLEILHLVQRAANDENPLLAGVEAQCADGTLLAHDLLLLPLRHRGMRSQRMLGMLSAAKELPVFAPVAVSLALVAYNAADQETRRRALRTPSLQVGIPPAQIMARKGHLVLIDGKQD